MLKNGERCIEKGNKNSTIRSYAEVIGVNKIRSYKSKERDGNLSKTMIFGMCFSSFSCLVNR